jgi:hypothetical protein
MFAPGENFDAEVAGAFTGGAATASGGAAIAEHGGSREEILVEGFVDQRLTIVAPAFMPSGRPEALVVHGAISFRGCLKLCLQGLEVFWDGFGVFLVSCFSS